MTYPCGYVLELCVSCYPKSWGSVLLPRIFLMVRQLWPLQWWQDGASPSTALRVGFSCLGSFGSELWEKCCLGALFVCFFLVLPGDSLLGTTVPFPRVTVSGLKAFVWSPTVDSSRPHTVLSASMNFDLSDQTLLRLCLPCSNFLVVVLFYSEFLWEESLKTR